MSDGEKTTETFFAEDAWLEEAVRIPSLDSAKRIGGVALGSSGS